jgi:hypothetical protein
MSLRMSFRSDRQFKVIQSVYETDWRPVRHNVHSVLRHADWLAVSVNREEQTRLPLRKPLAGDCDQNVHVAERGRATAATRVDVANPNRRGAAKLRDLNCEFHNLSILCSPMNTPSLKAVHAANATRSARIFDQNEELPDRHSVAPLDGSGEPS